MLPDNKNSNSNSSDLKQRSQVTVSEPTNPSRSYKGCAAQISFKRQFPAATNSDR